MTKTGRYLKSFNIDWGEHRLITQRGLHMPASQWRRTAICIWLAASCFTFIGIDSMAVRSWLLLLVCGVIPPAMLLWAWNEDRPLPIESLSARRERR